MPISCELISSEDVHNFDRSVNMPPHHILYHQIHLMASEVTGDDLKCDEFCKVPNSKPKKVGLIDAIKSRLKIEDIASRLTELHGFGGRLRGRCPLHHEQNGQAFVVWIDTQTWRCFGQCVTGGDVLDFIKECKERNIEWRTQTPRTSPQGRPSPESSADVRRSEPLV